MTLLFAGSMAMEHTARLESRSVSGVQVVPLLTVFQTPPATPPRYMVAGVAGSMSRERTRPPTLPGPTPVQRPRAWPKGASALASAAETSLLAWVEKTGMACMACMAST